MSGYGVKLVAAVAFGFGSAHLMHAALSPVPALMMTWPLPRHDLQVFVVFMRLDYQGISELSSSTTAAVATLRGAVAGFIGAPCASDGK